MENIEPLQQMQESAIQTKNPLKIWVIILSVLVLGLIGVSIFFIKEIDQLSDKYTDLKNGSSEKVENNIVNTPTVRVTTTQPTKTETKIGDNYFVIKEWGLKFKIPNDLMNIKYEIDGDAIHFVAEPADQSLHYVSNINSIIKENSMADLLRSTESSKNRGDSMVNGKKLGNYYYYTAWSFSGLATGVGIQGSIFGANLDRYNTEDQKIINRTTELWRSLNETLKTIELN